MEQKTPSWKNTIRKKFFQESSFYSWMVFMIGISSCTAPEKSNKPQNKTIQKTQVPNTKTAWWENTTSIKRQALGTTYVIKTGEDSLKAAPMKMQELIEGITAEL